MVIAVVIVVLVLFCLAVGCIYSICWGKDDEDDTKLLDECEAGISLSRIASNSASADPKGTKNKSDVHGMNSKIKARYSQQINMDDYDDEYFGELDLIEEEEFRTIPDLPVKNSKEQQQRDKHREEVEAANLEMLENVLFSADTNEYEQRGATSMFDHISEKDIGSSVKKLGMQENDLENFLFSADANEYGMPASSVFTNVASKSILSKNAKSNNVSANIDPDMENVMFCVENNEFSEQQKLEDVVQNPILRLAKSGKAGLLQVPSSGASSGPQARISPRQNKQAKPAEMTQSIRQPVMQEAAHLLTDNSEHSQQSEISQITAPSISMDAEAESMEPTVIPGQTLRTYGSAMFDMSNIYGGPPSPRASDGITTFTNSGAFSTRDSSVRASPGPSDSGTRVDPPKESATPKSPSKPQLSSLESWFAMDQ
jgi:hypothetical protein